MNVLWFFVGLGAGLIAGAIVAAIINAGWYRFAARMNQEWSEFCAESFKTLGDDLDSLDAAIKEFGK